MIHKKSYICANKECEYIFSIFTDISNDNTFKPKKCPRCKGTEFIEKLQEPKE